MAACARPAATARRRPAIPNEPPFVVEAALTAEDVRAFDAMMMRRNRLPPNRRQAAMVTGGTIVAAFGGAEIALWLGATTERGQTTIAVLLMFAFAAGLMLMDVLVRRASAEAKVARGISPLALERRRFTLDDSGIGVTGPSADAHWYWPAMTEAVLENGMLVLWAGTMHAMAIPLRAFASPAESEAVLAFARARIAR